MTTSPTSTVRACEIFNPNPKVPSTMASTVFDHDPSINHIEAMIVKDDGVVGIKVRCDSTT